MKNLNSEEKLYYIFEHELAVSQNLPYKGIFENEPFKGYLFEEFRVAELKPCPWLYLEQYYSQEEYEEIQGNKRKIDEENAIYVTGNISIAASTSFPSEHDIKLSEIWEEFENKRLKKTLEPQFFCPDILKTNTGSILSKIKDEYEYFKKDFNDNKFDIYVESISNALNSISKIDLRNKIAEKLIADDFNIYDLDKNGSGYPEWHKRKFEFNHLIKKNFKKIDDDGECVIEMIKCLLLFKKFGSLFPGETKEKWIERFNRSSQTLSPLNIDKRVTVTNNKVVILGMLKALNENSENSFDFEEYVKIRWGIDNFHKYISDHNNKNGFTLALKDARIILAAK